MTTTRRKPPAKPETESIVARYAEKYGIYPALLIAGGYFVFVEVIEPIKNTYSTALTEIRQANEDLKDMVEEKANKDLEYGKKVLENLEKIREAIEGGIKKLENPSDERDVPTR